MWVDELIPIKWLEKLRTIFSFSTPSMLCVYLHHRYHLPIAHQSSTTDHLLISIIALNILILVNDNPNFDNTGNSSKFWIKKPILKKILLAHGSWHMILFWSNSCGGRDVVVVQGEVKMVIMGMAEGGEGEMATMVVYECVWERKRGDSIGLEIKTLKLL